MVNRPYGFVIATLGVYGEDEVEILLRAVEREMRERPEPNALAVLKRVRRELQGMVPRSRRQEWTGWSPPSPE